MKLRKYLDQQKQKPAHFAKQLGVSKVAVHYWLTEERKPKPAVAERIRALTGGAVDFADFYSL
jgi:DNA-binding transcriptional regulator YiaG